MINTKKRDLHLFKGGLRLLLELKLKNIFGISFCISQSQLDHHSEIWVHGIDSGAYILQIASFVGLGPQNRTAEQSLVRL